MATIVALLGLSVLLADPVAAHTCAQPVQVPVGETAAVTVGVGAEKVAVTAVEVEIPDGFQLERATGGEAWKVEPDGDVVRFTGSSIAPYACDFLTLRGVADDKAKLSFPLHLQTDDGESVTYDSTEPYRENSAQLVYAGLDIPPLPTPEEPTEPMGLGGWLVVGVVTLAIAGGGGLAWWRVRQQRSQKVGET